MSLLLAFAAAKGIVKGAKSVLRRRGAASQTQAMDSVVTTSTQVRPFYSSTRTVQYPSQKAASEASQRGDGRGAGMPGAACGPVWTGTRFRAQRMNKSTYVTRGGGTSRWPTQLIVHERGTECVTVRRRHVTNAKALRRAISRVRGFVKIYRKAAALVGGHHRRSSHCASCGKNPCRCK